MVSREEYMNFIREMLKEEVKKDEARLSKYKENRKYLVSIAVAVFVIVVIPMFIIHFISGIFAFVIWLVVASNVKLESKTYAYYKKEYRKRAIDFLLKENEYTFNDNFELNESVVVNSQLLDYFEELECKDMLSINIPNDDNSKSNCYLNLCDLKATREETREVSSFIDDDDSLFDGMSRTETVTVDVYKGMFGYVEFPFEFKCLMCINSEYRKKGVVLENVILEDTVFNKKFRVWCNDQIEARYILTPVTMEKLIFLKNRLNGLRITLVDNKMYIASRGINLFELGGTKEKPETLFERLYDDINVILMLVNEIKTNNKVFKM